jgi:CRISPR-associated protein Cmr6
MSGKPPYRNNLSDIYTYLTGTKQFADGKGIHAGLWLDKYIGGQTKEDTTSRRTLVEQVSLIPIPKTYEQFYGRWEELLQKGYGAKVKYAKVKGRMVVGLGDESVLETSVALHRTYGVPYIPGSALKGLAAHYAELRAGENRRWRKGGDLYNFVFGTTDGDGSIHFFDALYIPPDKVSDGRPLHPDVITVHHREYYQDQMSQDQKKAPADWDSPTPIPFLSATGTYLIALAAPELPEADQWITGVFTILEGALGEMGIGAKTSSGYGRMTLEFDPEVKRAQGYVREISQLPNKYVSRQIQGYYPQWQKFKMREARITFAKAIIEKVRQAGIEADKSRQRWYQEIVTFVQDNG